MRILYSHRVQSRDGQSVHIDELVTAFRRAGHEVCVVGPKLYEQTSFGGESRMVGLVRRLLPGSLAELAELLYNIPAFWRLRQSASGFAADFVYERYNLYYLAGLLLARLRRIPFYIEVNAPLVDERSRFGNLRLQRLARRLEAWVWCSAARVFVVTDVLRDMVAAAGVARERIVVTANGINREHFPAEPYRAQPDGPVTIGFIGFVRDWHGLDAVIAGMAEAKDGPTIRLVVVGDGPARPTLEGQAAALGLGDRVRFVGVQKREAIPETIRGFDIALQPRAVPYASPLKLFEYMACGRAIVAPDQPNLREVLADGENALLFDPEDATALWRAIKRLANDPALRERLGLAARDALDAHDYTWDGNARRVAAAAASEKAPRGSQRGIEFGRSAAPPSG